MASGGFVTDAACVPFDGPLTGGARTGIVKIAMLSWRKNFKVLGAIVSLVVIAVVNVLRGQEWSPKTLFGHDSVLQDVPAIYTQVNVPSMESSPSAPIKMCGASRDGMQDKVPCWYLRRPSDQRSSVADVAAKPRWLAGGATISRKRLGASRAGNRVGGHDGNLGSRDESVNTTTADIRVAVEIED